MKRGAGTLNVNTDEATVKRKDLSRITLSIAVVILIVLYIINIFALGIYSDLSQIRTTGLDGVGPIPKDKIDNSKYIDGLTHRENSNRQALVIFLTISTTLIAAPILYNLLPAVINRNAGELILICILVFAIAILSMSIEALDKLRRIRKFGEDGLEPMKILINDGNTNDENTKRTYFIVGLVVSIIGLLITALVMYKRK